MALDAAQLAQVSLTPKIFKGVISVSGAGLDMTDQKTYDLGESPSYFAQRFDPLVTNPNWQRTASPATYAAKGAPPFLISYAEGETKSLVRQSQVFSEILTARGSAEPVVANARPKPRAHGVADDADRTNALSTAITDFILENWK